jgi:hypothetical protein
MTAEEELIKIRKILMKILKAFHGEDTST